MEKAYLIALIALLSFGCISINYEQTINPDGSSVVSNSMDMGPLLEYAQNLSNLYGPMTLEEPDTSYDSGDYSSLPSFESEGLTLQAVESYYYGDAFENLTPGDSAYATYEIRNDGEEELLNLNVQFKSGALVSSSYYSSDEYIGSLEKREYATVYFSPDVANVTPGTYYATIIAQYDTATRENVTVAKTIEFQVNEAVDEMEELENMDLCANFTDPGVECTYEDGKLALSKEVMPDGDLYQFEKAEGLFETEYHVLITGPYEIGVSDDAPDVEGLDTSMFSSVGTKFEDGFDSPMVTAASLKTMLELTYKINMPAKIVNASAPGKVSDDGMSVTYDMLDLYEEKVPIEIYAKEENTFMMYLLFGVVGLAVLAVIIFAVLQMKGNAG